MMGLEGLLTGHLLCERYRVERVIGRGGMGAVYRAADLRLERAVAVKVITTASPDVATRSRLRARFHREARAAARLQHPNVVTVYDFGTDGRLDLDFLVMELLEGEDAATRLARPEPLALGDALEIVEQAGRGLGAGHRLGLVHRDVKPGNLFLVDRHGGIRVCVLDFGIVQLVADDEEATMTQLTVAGRGPHSPAYAAPEQLRGEARLTAASDVWGLGVTAFQIVTGERPFTELEQRRMKEGAALPAPSARLRNPSVPRAVDDVLRIALSHRQADRFQNAGEFAHALASARRSAPLSEAVPALSRPGSNGPQPEDRTLLRPGPQAPPERSEGRRHWGFAPPRVATESNEATLLDPLRSTGSLSVADVTRPPAPAFVPRSPPAPSGAPGRWLRRAVFAVWQLALTAVALAAAGAFGAGMFRAFNDNLVEPFYASVVGLTLTMPWAVHRLFGRRGSYLLAVLASAGIAVGVFRLLAPLTGPHAAVVTLPIAQLVVSGWILRLTRRRDAPEPSSMSASIPF